jgi:hypothetical protein
MTAAAIARIDALLAIARRIADPSDRLGQEARARLALTTGLSPAGVELVLTEHLEVAPTDAELEQLLGKATPAERCHVVLAANVCTAPLRAIAWALAGSPQVKVKPSRRDPVLAELLVHGLHSPDVQLVTEIVPGPNDAVHVYGSDETIDTIRAELPGSVRFSGHGTGIGIAIGDDAEAIADDLVPFDGKGCLSPRLVLTDADPRPLARALHEALERRGDTIPRGQLSAADRAALARSRRTFAAVGDVDEGPHHAVFTDEDARAPMLAPALRATVVARPADVTAYVTAIARHVAAIGGADGPLLNAVVSLCPRARRSPLGHMQKPPLDGPVDLR